MKRRLTHIVVLCVVMVSAPVVGGAKSIFNLNLVGERVESGDVRAVALGGGYHLVADSLAILQFNPAMISYTQRVTIAASQFMGTSRSESELYDERAGSYKVTGLGLAFPLLRGFSLGLEFRANTDPTGQFSVEKTSASGEAYDEEFERSGGLSSYTGMLAASLTPRIKVGVGGSVESGRMTDTWRVGFDSGVGQDAFSQQKRTMRGYSAKAGVVLWPHRHLAVGVTYRGEIDYDTDVEIRHTNTSVNDAYDEHTVIPALWSASAAWTVSSNWTLHAGGQYSDYTQFEGLAFPTDRLQAQQVFSAGAEQRRGPLRIPLRFSMSATTG